MTHAALKDQVSAAILVIRQHRRMPDVRGIVEARADTDSPSLQHHGRAIANNVNAGKLAVAGPDDFAARSTGEQPGPMTDDAGCVERHGSGPSLPAPAVAARRCHAEDMKRFEAPLLEARNSQPDTAGWPAA